MTPTSTPKELREQRAARVAQLRIRRIPIRKIAEILAQEGIVNKNGRPYTHTTIANDIKRLEAQWMEDSKKSISEHKANQIAELTEALRVAWARIKTTKEGEFYAHEDIAEIRKINELLAKILGTNAPKESIIGGMGDNPIMVKGYTNVSPDEWGE